jgi:hypothetical protein
LKILIEVFQNIPPGNGCLTLAKNVMDVVYGGSIDYDIDILFFTCWGINLVKKRKKAQQKATL